METAITEDKRGKRGRSSNVVRGHVYGEKLTERLKARHRLEACQAREQQERKARTIAMTRLNNKTIIIHSPKADYAEVLIEQSAGQAAEFAEAQALRAEREAEQERLRAEREAEQERLRAEREAKQAQARARRRERERARRRERRRASRATKQAVVETDPVREARRVQLLERKRAYNRVYYQAVVKPRNERKKQLGL